MIEKIFEKQSFTRMIKRILRMAETMANEDNEIREKSHYLNKATRYFLSDFVNEILNEITNKKNETKPQDNTKYVRRLKRVLRDKDDKVIGIEEILPVNNKGA